MRYAEIFEARQAPLYHFMDFKKAMAVLTSDAMPAQWKHRIGEREIAGNSFTRNPHLNWGQSFVRITVDQARLAMNHRIMPLDGELTFAHTFGYNWQNSPHMRDRIKNTELSTNGRKRKDFTLSEEFVVGDIKSLSKYTTEVYLFHSGSHFISGSKAVDLYETVKAYCEKYNIQVKIGPSMERFVQDTLRDWATPDEDR